MLDWETINQTIAAKVQGREELYKMGIQAPSGPARQETQLRDLKRELDHLDPTGSPYGPTVALADYPALLYGDSPRQGLRIIDQWSGAPYTEAATLNLAFNAWLWAHGFAYQDTPVGMRAFYRSRPTGGHRLAPPAQERAVVASILAMKFTTPIPIAHRYQAGRYDQPMYHLCTHQSPGESGYPYRALPTPYEAPVAVRWALYSTALASTLLAGQCETCHRVYYCTLL